MTYHHEITGRIIRSIREQKGLTQEALSELVGVSRSHLAEIESGRTRANVNTLWRVSQALGMRLSGLIRIDDGGGEGRLIPILRRRK